MLLRGRARPRQPSFLRALLATFCSTLLISIGLKVIQDLLSFVNPQLLRSDHVRFGCHPPWASGGCWLSLRTEPRGTTCSEMNPRPGPRGLSPLAV